MIQLDIKADVTEARRFYRNVKERAISRAASRAINDSLVTMRAEGARQIKSEHPALRIGDIKNNITTTKATANNLTGSVETKGKPLSATLFGVGGGGGTRRTRGARGQLSVTRTSRPLTAKFGTQRTQIQYQGRKAFRVLAFGNEVFVRQFANSRKLRRFRGPSLPGVFRAQTQFFLALARRRWEQTFPSRMQYEIELAKR